MMENSKNEKIVEKIKKVLELSKNNTSTEEAKSAALKAQKLMAEYHISMAEVEAIEDIDNIVEVTADIGTGNKWKYALSAIIAKNFRCKYFYYGRSTVAFYGYEEDAQIAASTFQMLFIVGNKEATKYYQKKRNEYLRYGEKFNGKYIKNAFLNGYLSGIKEVLDKQCTALMIVIPQKVKDKYKDRSAGFSQVSNSFKIRTNVDGERAKNEGRRIGKDTLMRKGIEAVC